MNAPFSDMVIIMVVIIIQGNLFLLYLFSFPRFVGCGVVGAGGVWALLSAFVAR